MNPSTVNTHWLVEASPAYSKEQGAFLDVGAESMSVKGGALIFKDDGEIVHVLAPGTWQSVTRESD